MLCYSVAQHLLNTFITTWASLVLYIIKLYNNLSIYFLIYSEIRDLKDPELIKKSAKEAIKSLETVSKQSHVEVPISEFVKILIWEKENLFDIQHNELMRDIAADKRDGWKVESHTIFGEDFDTYRVNLRFN